MSKMSPADLARSASEAGLTPAETDRYVARHAAAEDERIVQTAGDAQTVQAS